MTTAANAHFTHRSPRLAIRTASQMQNAATAVLSAAKIDSVIPRLYADRLAEGSGTRHSLPRLPPV